jgi:hypothetical protein
MDLISILVFLAIAALIYWVITTLGLPDMIQKIATVVLVVFVCLWLLNLIAPGSVGSLGLH